MEVDDFGAAVADVLCALVYTRSGSASNAGNNMTRSNQLRIISCVVCFGNGNTCCVRDDQIVCLIRNAVCDSDMAAVAGLLVVGVIVSDDVEMGSMSCVSRQL